MNNYDIEQIENDEIRNSLAKELGEKYIFLKTEVAKKIKLYEHKGKKIFYNIAAKDIQDEHQLDPTDIILYEIMLNAGLEEDKEEFIKNNLEEEVKNSNFLKKLALTLSYNSEGKNYKKTYRNLMEEETFKDITFLNMSYSNLEKVIKKSNSAEPYTPQEQSSELILSKRNTPDRTERGNYELQVVEKIEEIMAKQLSIHRKQENEKKELQQYNAEKLLDELNESARNLLNMPKQIRRWGTIGIFTLLALGGGVYTTYRHIEKQNKEIKSLAESNKSFAESNKSLVSNLKDNNTTMSGLLTNYKQMMQRQGSLETMLKQSPTLTDAERKSIEDSFRAQTRIYVQNLKNIKKLIKENQNAASSAANQTTYKFNGTNKFFKETTKKSKKTKPKRQNKRKKFKKGSFTFL